MALSNIAVITSEPDGTKPRLKFFSNEEAAFDHAGRICKDLNRDAYVVQVTHRFHACRQTWGNRAVFTKE